jgi:hypothetical protein
MSDPDPDSPMTDPGRGPPSTSVGRSPANRERSASPRARTKSSRRREPLEWGFNTNNVCITHRGTKCQTCSDYVSHVNEAAMEDDKSYIAAMNKRSDAFVPKSEWRKECDIYNNLLADYESLRSHTAKVESELDASRCAVDELETELALMKETARSTSYASAVSRQASSRVATAPKPPINLKVAAQSTKGKGKAPLPPPPVPVKPSPKGKGRVVTADDYELAMSYDDDEFDDPDRAAQEAVNYADAPDSVCANQVRAILAGTPYSHPSRSGGAFVQGRMAEVTPTNEAQFIFAREALEAAHREQNTHKTDLLNAIRRYVTKCHATPASQRTEVQKAALLQWRLPDWASVMVFDPNTNTMVHGGATKEELRNAKANRKTVDHQKLYLQVSDRLGLTVNGVPDSRIGNINSPMHQDHPLLWMYWVKYISKMVPKGLGKGWKDFPSERAVRGFRRLAPLFKTRKNSSAAEVAFLQSGRVISLEIIALVNKYAELLTKYGIEVNPIPSWDPIVFSSSDEKECVQRLAERGVTVFDANDAQEFAFNWLSDTQRGEKDTQVRIQINRVLEDARAIRLASTVWPAPSSYLYNDGLARWMPVWPQTSAGTRALPVPNPANAGTTTPSSQPQGGAPEVKPDSLAAPPEAIASGSTEAPAGDENVIMGDDDIPAPQESDTMDEDGQLPS